MSAFYIAKKYNIHEFKQQCLNFLEKNINNDNVLCLLMEAHHLDEPQIESWCYDYIDQHATEVLRSADFVETDLNTLTAIIERNTLQIREIELYEAVVRWAAAECKRQELPLTPDNQRSVLKSAFMLIRFPLMSFEEFVEGGPTEDELLKHSELKHLLLYITKNPKPTTNFLSVRRSAGPGNAQTVNRFKSTSGESKWISNVWNGINFIIDRPVFIVGFGLYGSSTASKHDVYMDLDRTDGLVCARNDTSFTCDGSTKTCQVRFKEPFKIEPNTMYTVVIYFKDKPAPYTWYGLEGQDKVSINDQNGLPVNFQFSIFNDISGRNKTNVSMGQIPEVMFYT